MTVFLVLLIPLLLMVFALFMERVEKRLKTSTVSEADVQEFLDTARPEEVNTLIREGWTKAFANFRLRRRPPLQAQTQGLRPARATVDCDLRCARSVLFADPRPDHGTAATTLTCGKLRRTTPDPPIPSSATGGRWVMVGP